MSTPIILLNEIRKSYFMGKQALEVLKGVSLNINKNEYVALMGPSGSGKSTLMNILGCLDSPTLGTYILNGQDVSKMEDNDLAEVRNKEIGFVFQQALGPIIVGLIHKKSTRELSIITLEQRNGPDTITI